MILEHATYDTVEIIKLPEKLIMANAAETREAIRSIVGSISSQLILDLHEVLFIDSSGLSVLVSALKASQELQGRVVLLSPSDDVRSLIELTRLHQIFEIFEDRNAAIQSFH